MNFPTSATVIEFLVLAIVDREDSYILLKINLEICQL